MMIKSNFVIIFILLSLIIRLVLAYNLDGSFDTWAWSKIAEALRRGEGIYSSETIYFSSSWQLYNYPPLWAYLIRLVDWISSIIHLPFSFMLKIPVITAEIIMVYLIASQLNKLIDRFKIWLLLYANPFSIILAGYHGQYDLLFLLFIVMALISVRQKRWSMVVIYNAISLACKTIPLIVLSAQFNFWPKGSKKLIILSLIIILPLLLLVPYIFDPKSINGILRIFNYYGLTGVWGLPKVLDWVAHPFPDTVRSTIISLYMPQRTNIFLVFYLFTVVTVYRSKTKMLNAVFLLFLTFNCFASGFGVQYFYWLMPFSLWLRKYRQIALYSLLVTIFSSGFYLKFLTAHDRQILFFANTTVSMFEKYHLAGLLGTAIYLLCVLWWMIEMKVLLKRIKH